MANRARHGLGRHWSSTALVVQSALGLLVSCAGAQVDASRRAALPRDTRIVHEPCAIDDAERQDVDGDGRPDLNVVREKGREVCRGLDLNFDGHIDVWVYLDDSGRVRRREHDFDRDGRVDEIALYDAGALVERRQGTTLAGKLDTWQYFERGRVVRMERDSNGDDVVDQWWEFPNPSRHDCPLIHTDVDGDGRPDPGATVDLCEDERAAGESEEPSVPGAEPPANTASTPSADGAEVDEASEGEEPAHGEPAPTDDGPLPAPEPSEREPGERRR